jgi:DNA-binding XRE family transcriptional regulator
VSLPKYQRVAAIVRRQVADGLLAPGAPAPSGTALARMTGCSVLTCRRALRTLIADGVLVPGVSRNARPRVPGTDRGGPGELADAERALSAALARYRHAAGLTQPQLAGLIGLSVTTIGHAETGRLWQSRPFWELADKVLDADGELLSLHDACRAAEVAPASAPGTESAGTESAAPTPVSDEPVARAGELPPETAPAENPARVTVGASELVTCITITWAGGAATTVYPPDTGEPAISTE